MTSGLVPDYTTDDTMNNAGDTLFDAISMPLIGEKGEWDYLTVNNILSYVIWQTTCARGDSSDSCMTLLWNSSRRILCPSKFGNHRDCRLSTRFGHHGPWQAFPNGHPASVVALQ